MPKGNEELISVQEGLKAYTDMKKKRNTEIQKKQASRYYNVMRSLMSENDFEMRGTATRRNGNGELEVQPVDFEIAEIVEDANTTED